MSAPSFEFLASLADWEAACLRTPETINKLPYPLESPARWTLSGTMLNTLAPFTEGKAGITKQSLASLAKDGENPRGNKNAAELIQGFPGFVRSTTFTAKTKDNGEPTDLALWQQFSEPTPDLLDALPEGSILLRIRVQLTSPWYSRDDLAFYPMENALRRNAVFDIPFLSAAGLKGLIHWAHHMVRQSLEDDADALVLFGHAAENSDDKSNQQGLLYCYPVNWTGSLGLEVINPQRPATGGGTNPIKYEVLQPGGEGTLFFLLANLPGARTLKRTHVQAFLQALGYLLDEGTLSAKSTIGWGRVSLLEGNFAVGGMGQDQALASSTPLLQQAQDKAADEAWQAITSSDGTLLPLSGNENVFTNKRLKALLPGVSNKMLKDRAACYAQIEELFAARTEQASPDQEASTATATWLLGETGPKDFSAFSDHVLQVLAKKEGAA